MNIQKGKAHAYEYFTQAIRDLNKNERKKKEEEEKRLWSPTNMRCLNSKLKKYIYNG